MGLYKLERYSHEGYLIKVVVMALAGEVAREISPIWSWSINNNDLKLAEKARERECEFGKRCQLTRSLSHDRPARKRYFSLPPSGQESTNTRVYFFSLDSDGINFPLAPSSSPSDMFDHAKVSAYGDQRGGCCRSS